MAKSAQLRANKKQHVPKNILSKGDDRNVAEIAETSIRSYIH